MTVSELIEELELLPEDMEVKVLCNSKDYWGTVLAMDIVDFDEGFIKYSDYHDTNVLIDDYFEGNESNDKKGNYITMQVRIEIRDFTGKLLCTYFNLERDDRVLNFTKEDGSIKFIDRSKKLIKIKYYEV